jgi:hypothetical protein
MDNLIEMYPEPAQKALSPKAMALKDIVQERIDHATSQLAELNNLKKFLEDHPDYETFANLLQKTHIRNL